MKKFRWGCIVVFADSLLQIVIGSRLVIKCIAASRATASPKTFVIMLRELCQNRLNFSQILKYVVKQGIFPIVKS